MSEESNSPKKSPRTIFLIEEDNNVRPGLTNTLRQLGYRTLVAADLEDAFEWMSAEGHINADLVLMNLVGKTPGEVLRVGRGLKAHAKYDGHTPLVVLPEKIPQELEGTNENVNGNEWVCYFDGDLGQLGKLLADLIGK